MDEEATAGNGKATTATASATAAKRKRRRPDDEVVADGAVLATQRSEKGMREWTVGEDEVGETVARNGCASKLLHKGA